MPRQQQSIFFLLNYSNELEVLQPVAALVMYYSNVILNYNVRIYDKTYFKN